MKLNCLNISFQIDRKSNFTVKFRVVTNTKTKYINSANHDVPSHQSTYRISELVTLAPGLRLRAALRVAGSGIRQCFYRKVSEAFWMFHSLTFFPIKFKTRIKIGCYFRIAGVSKPCFTLNLELQLLSVSVIGLLTYRQHSCCNSTIHLLLNDVTLSSKIHSYFAYY